MALRRSLTLLSIAVLALAAPKLSFAQGETTSAIVGQVSDATGAGVPGALVALVGEENGLKRTVSTGDAGRFSFPQLKPGSYSLRVSASGFELQTRYSVLAGLGQTETVNIVLKVAAAKEEVLVTAEPTLINTENPNTATTLGAKALENLPNPGSDLTYPAQFAPGALINTAGSSNDFVGAQNGYGNVQFNGLPALSNAYIVDGLETNDPLTNLNSGLSTNLVLGLNSIAEVTVNTTSYAVDQGRYGASQINYVTKSGTNAFHGNAYELWNGSRLNAADFFTNATSGNHKPRSNVNHFGASIGGPVKRDRLFFFVDFEQLRIAVPIVTPVTVPSPAFESYVLAQLPRGGVDPVSGATYPANPALVPFYRNMFSLYSGAGGTALPVLGCPFNSDGAPASGYPPNGDGCALRRSVSQSSADHEQVVTARIDHNISNSNSVWYRFQADTGVQAAYTDPINPLFNATSPQPLYSFAAGYTHIFNQNLVNYFNPAFSWYESLFGPDNPAQTLAAFPIVLQGSGGNAPFTTVGGLDDNWIQGRRATRFQVSDSLSWSVGRHQLKFGLSSRRLRINDFDFSTYTTPLATYTTLAQFTYGVASTLTRSFPVAASQPFNYLNLDFYAQDSIRITSTLNWTIGVRSAFNSNPLNPHDLLARLSGSFDAASHDVDQPLNAALQTGLARLFPSTPLLLWQPRTALAWQFLPGSVIRAGFGVFSDILPGSIADLIGANPPYVNVFQGGLLGSAGGLAIAPGVPNSAVDATAAANEAFIQGFQQGELSCASAKANPQACLPRVAIAAVPDGMLRAPYFMQWSLALEHQFGAAADLRVQYVGTRAVNLPYQVQANGYQTVCSGCFAPFPYLSPEDPRFGAVDQFTTGANSHYNGLQVTAEKRMAHGLEVRANYTWSHCLDTVSNGGFLSFSSAGILSPLPGELGRQYGDCDYDVRHNFNASYVYELPIRVRQAWLKKVVENWQLSGSVFRHTGLPFTVLSAPYTANGNGIIQGGGPQFASVVPGAPLYVHQPIAGVTQPGTIQWLNPDAFISTVDPSTGACNGGDSPSNCQFGNLGRNTLRGPGFFWSDLYLTKKFKLNERVSLRVDGQFFNVLNHPNFALPSSVAGIPGKAGTQTGFGAITSTTSPPTGLLGVGLGGDNSPRMIALQMRLQF
jgi:carboxypeptidase family protein